MKYNQSIGLVCVKLNYYFLSKMQYSLLRYGKNRE